LEINSTRKLHLPLLNGIQAALKEVFISDKKSDQVVPAVLKANPKWGSRDRSFVAQNSYEIVRNKRLILHCMEYEGEINEEALQSMIGTWLTIKGLIDNSDFFNGLDIKNIKNLALVSDPKIKFSMPDELNAYIIGELGEGAWYKELEAMSVPAEVYLRVNLNRITREKVQNLLKSQGIETEVVNGVQGALRLLKRSNISSSEVFRKGFFEIQDAGSQLISEFLNPIPGSMVIDACAGAGGKTLHLADIMQNKGQIVAMDVEVSKLNELQNRVLRNKVSIISSELVNNAALDKYKEKADYLLLDVPCSGLGVIKRNPDSKEKLTLDFIEEIKQVQQNILSTYSSMLKKGGELVYATCSLLPSENRMQVDQFLSTNAEFELIKDKQIWPSETGFDGFYMALLKRK
jgi:16S rRNA (cytosine967-C5)-methyltransferase